MKKRMQREGVFREMRRRRFYEKPSDRITRKKAEAAIAQAGAQTSDPGWTDRRTARKAPPEGKSKPSSSVNVVGSNAGRSA